MDVVGRKMAQQELPPLFLQVAGACVDDEDAVAARRHEEPAARHAVGHLEDLDDVGDVLGPALVAQFVAVEGIVVRVEQVEAAGRGDPHRAVVVGHDRKLKLRASRMSSPDIRAGIALLIAAMSANGTSIISNIEQIDRGYENIEARLNALGAKIERI